MNTSKVLSGKDTAIAVYDSFKQRLDALSKKGIVPGLCVILLGEDPASQIYVRTKSKKIKSLGLKSKTIYLDSEVSQNELIKLINSLNQDFNYHGILVQMPLPSHIDSQKVINSIDPRKDVDGFHPENVGWLSIGKPRFIPCTPKGIMKIFKHYKIELSGKDVVVIGRSNIVGRPMSILVSSNSKWSNGTCTICHSRTKDLEQYTRNADVMISAIGRPMRNFTKEIFFRDWQIKKFLFFLQTFAFFRNLKISGKFNFCFRKTSDKKEMAQFEKRRFKGEVTK